MKTNKKIMHTEWSKMRVLTGVLVAALLIIGSGSVLALEKPVLPSNASLIEAKDMSFDQSTGKITYTLPEPALVRIRIGFKNGGPLLMNLLDWEKQDKGTHTVIWDRKDSSGKMDLSNRRDITVVVACLPVNAPKPARPELSPGMGKAPGFTITFPASSRTTAPGLPVIGGIAPVRVTIDEKDKKFVTESKFEVSIFIDTVFLLEDEEGTSPFTYQLDTRSLNDGPHLITVNLVLYSREVGTASVMVEVNNQRSKQ